MLMLHFYWFSLFVKILLKFVRKGEAEDTISATEKKTEGTSK